MSNAPLATDAPRNIVSPVAAPVTGSDFAARLRVNSEYIVIPLFALLIAAALFALFLLAIGKSPVDFVAYVWRGGFGTAFSLQNSLQRSAPLILTALAVAVPARSVLQYPFGSNFKNRLTSSTHPSWGLNTRWQSIGDRNMITNWPPS